MFGFGWVRTHLGVVFGEAFGLFWSFGLISGKRDEIRENLCVLFCFAIPFFRGLVYWTNEDPISV